MPAFLNVQAMPSARRGDQGDRYLPGVPVGNILITLQVPGRHSFVRQKLLNPLVVMLVPVADQHALAVGLLYQIQ